MLIYFFGFFQGNETFNTMRDFLLSNFSISSEMLSENVVCILALIVVGVVIGFAVGKRRLTGLLIGSYAALAILEAVPANTLFENEYAKAAVFFGLLVLFTFMDIYFFGTLFSNDVVWQWIVLSVLEAGMLAAVFAHLLPKHVVLAYVPANLFQYFSVGWAHFSLMIAPLLFLFIINRSK